MSCSKRKLKGERNRQGEISTSTTASRAAMVKISAQDTV